MAPSRNSVVPDVILASASTVRAALLRSAGVNIVAETAKIDEASLKQAMLEENASPGDLADYLAEMKARRVAHRHPEKLVLGCDQVLVQDGSIYSKPADLADARAQLLSLRGRAHELLSAVVIFEHSRPVWRHVGHAQLTMRDFSDSFLDNYLVQNPKSVLHAVGCYHLEGLGAQLFSRVQGDYFSVLGLPLLEILGFLRTRGVCLE